MSSTMELILPAIQSLEDEYGDMSKVPPNDSRLKTVRDRLNGNDSRTNFKSNYMMTKQKQSLAKLNDYIKLNNCSISAASKELHMGSQSARGLYINFGIQPPYLCSLKISKKGKAFYASNRKIISNFLKIPIARIDYCKKIDRRIDGWKISNCKKSSLNVPKNQRLDEALVHG